MQKHRLCARARRRDESGHLEKLRAAACARLEGVTRAALQQLEEGRAHLRKGGEGRREGGKEGREEGWWCGGGGVGVVVWRCGRVAV